MVDRVLSPSIDRVDEAAAQFARADDIPKVQLAYPRQGVWSGANQLGVELPFVLNTETPQTILKLDEWGFPEVWTVSLSVVLPPQGLVDGQFFDCTAEISMGSGGIVQSFDVDWVDGTVFALPMNALNIRARWNDAAAAFGIIPPDGVKVSALLSRGAPARSRATVSKFFILLHLGEATSTASAIPHDLIPRFSKSLQIVPIGPADGGTLYSANFEVSFFTNKITTNPIMTMNGQFLGPSIKVPIPAGARYYGVKINGTASAAGWAIFNLFDE